MAVWASLLGSAIGWAIGAWLSKIINGYMRWLAYALAAVVITYLLVTIELVLNVQAYGAPANGIPSIYAFKSFLFVFIVTSIIGARKRKSGARSEIRQTQQTNQGQPSRRDIEKTSAGVPKRRVTDDLITSPDDPADTRDKANEVSAEEAEAVPDQTTKDDKINLGDFPKAQMAIEYRPDVLEAWAKTQALPVPFQRRFMESLELDPRSDAQKIAISLKEEFNREERPYDDEAANDALVDVQTISSEAAIDFKNVYETLGDTVPVSKILERIEAAYGPSERTIALEERNKKAELEKQRRRQKLVETEEKEYQLQKERERLARELGKPWLKRD